MFFEVSSDLVLLELPFEIFLLSFNLILRFSFEFPFDFAGSFF